MCNAHVLTRIHAARVHRTDVRCSAWVLRPRRARYRERRTCSGKEQREIVLLSFIDMSLEGLCVVAPQLGDTALDLARREGHAPIVELLVSERM